MSDLDFFNLEVFKQDDKRMVRYFTHKGIVEEEEKQKPFYFKIAKGGEWKLVDNHRALVKIEYDDPNFRDFNLSMSYQTDVPYINQLMIVQDKKIGTLIKCYFDIEVDVNFTIPDPKVHPIRSIGMIFSDGRKEFLHGDEDKMISDFLKLTKNVGMLIGWNSGWGVFESRSFDLHYLAKRYKGGDKEIDFDYQLRHCAYIDLLDEYKMRKKQKSEHLAGGYSLENVSKHELGRGKIKHSKGFSDMSMEELEAYNMEDCQLTMEIDQKYALTDTLLEIARKANLPLTTWREKAKNFLNKRFYNLKPLVITDSLIIKEALSLGLVWNNREYVEKLEKFKGAGVLEPLVGVHTGVQNVDVSSMYPSIMIHERISPDKDRLIVPNILKRNVEERKRLKQLFKETKDPKYDLQQNTNKIINNTIYGSMGSEACRAYRPELAEAITRKGKDLLMTMKRISEEMGFKVLYGDTDSIFIQITHEKAQILVDMINKEIAPYTVEADEFYKAILFKGTKQGGTKKAYFAMYEDGSFKIRGFQAINSSYCVLAQEVQTTVARMLMTGSSILTCNEYIRGVQKQLRRGVLDRKLVMTKGVKDMADYKTKTVAGKERRLQPHIRAYKKLYDKGYRAFSISYYYTTGAEDVTAILPQGDIPKNLDYDHYMKTQIQMVVDPLFLAINVQNGRSGGFNKKALDNYSLEKWA